MLPSTCCLRGSDVIKATGATSTVFSNLTAGLLLAKRLRSGGLSVCCDDKSYFNRNLVE
jgi:hypothetical protein